MYALDEKEEAKVKNEERKIADGKKESEEKKIAPKATEEKVIESGKKDSDKNNKEDKAEVDDENDGHESPIRLTLEDDDETLHDVEVRNLFVRKQCIYFYCQYYDVDKRN
ncbi:hypothetical protein NQ314_020647 [Rhamnusium bicolor]|uniref:Uncharacterized protein n=1 Tax=Rhamnusium bicolor TaxID=1586634 RepID=A0AAV8WM70_9CUCU|nr:hypothetical protein NQ314_020647 [Rhamnusium bicolor]